MTEKTKARKPRRKLSEIDFSGEGAHIALVGKSNGGPANGADYALVIKGRNFSEEFVEKVQQVKVTMELPDFLQKFFYLIEEDAKVLAYMMGYVEEAETQAEENMEAEEEYQDWIKSKMEAFEIIKSLHEADSLAEILSEISEDEYLAVLNDQQELEKAFKAVEKAKGYKPKEGDMVTWNSSGGKAKGKVEHVMTQGTLGVPGTEFSVTASADNPAVLIRIYRDDKPTETMVGHRASTLTKVRKVSKANAEDDTSRIGTEVNEDEVDTSVINKANKEDQMQTEVKSVEQEVTVEMVEKSAFESVQKALEEQKVALQKAMETIAQFEAEKKEAIVKAKTAKLQEVVDAKHLQVVAKAALALESDEEFDSFVSAMKEMKEVVEKSALFQEQGASGESEEIVKESGVAKILKAKLQTKQSK